jgi:choline-sulfatase
MYISDHGEMLGSHGFWTKSVMYEDSAAVPMMLAGPRRAGRHLQRYAGLADRRRSHGQAGGGVEAGTGSRALDVAPGAGVCCASPEPDRFVISQYHDGGAPTGFYMLRYRQWKYVHYAGRDADQLFDLSADARELNDLGRSAMHEREREMLRTLLGHVLDPDAVNAQPLQTSSALIARTGRRGCNPADGGFRLYAGGVRKEASR